MYSNGTKHYSLKNIKFRKKGLSSGSNGSSWAIWITLWTFILSISLNLLSTHTIENSTTIIAIILLIFIIMIGILFDMIGIAFASADETPFHAMASRKVFAAKYAISLIRNANKVSSFCNDVIGDICGIFSGSLSAFIFINIISTTDTVYSGLYNLILGALVASLTVGGKALGKTFAIEKCNYIVYAVSTVVGFCSLKIFRLKRLDKSK